jgi:hypothetical protein
VRRNSYFDNVFSNLYDDFEKIWGKSKQYGGFPSRMADFWMTVKSPKRFVVTCFCSNTSQIVKRCQSEAPQTIVSTFLEMIDFWFLHYTQPRDAHDSKCPCHDVPVDSIEQNLNKDSDQKVRHLRARRLFLNSMFCAL